ncbi:hypothetical protein MJ561_17870 [Klebsiella pneumoniae]|nr:hypothetical protein MJ561_17870 [Klebsiella pneumoniae]
MFGDSVDLFHSGTGYHNRPSPLSSAVPLVTLTAKRQRGENGVSQAMWA